MLPLAPSPLAPLLRPDPRPRHLAPPGFAPHPAPLLGSFFFAGFEGSATYNIRREWIDGVAATQHDEQVEEDYRRLRHAGLLATREVIRWPLVDHRGRLDFSSARPFAEAAHRQGIQVLWDLFHYGYPPDLDPLTDEFVRRFAAYCRAAARFVALHTDGPHYFTPINEPSFLSWAGGSAGRFSPHLHGRGPDLKLALVRAAIAGINAIRSELPAARMVNVDPVCRVVPSSDPSAPWSDPEDFNQRAVFESWDMLCGRTRPELGGSRRHLDIVGVNYYWSNQWEIGREEQALPDDDPRRVPLRDLLREVWRRYGGEFFVTETAHVDEHRAPWLHTLATECEALLDEGLPLRGVCLYPILGMPEWHDPTTWTRMGLWDLIPENGILRRQAHTPMLEALHAARRLDRHPGACVVPRA